MTPEFDSTNRRFQHALLRGESSTSSSRRVARALCLHRRDYVITASAAVRLGITIGADRYAR